MAAGSVAVFGAPTTAQVDTSDPVPISVDPTSGDPVATDHRRPSISADGTVVVFDVDVDSGDGRVVVADRTAGTTEDLAGQRSSSDPEGIVTAAPAVSADGCRVAFSALLPAPATGAAQRVELRVVDRCPEPASASTTPSVPADETATTIDAATTTIATDDAATTTTTDTTTTTTDADAGTETTDADATTTTAGAAPSTAAAPAPREATTVDAIDVIDAPARFAVPVLSADGTTIAWSTGDEVRRFVLDPDDDGWSLTDRIDATPPSAAAGLPTSADMVTDAAIALSADGDTLAFAAGPGGVPFEPSPPNVFVWSISDGMPTIELASMTADGAAGAAASTAPSLSADGRLLVFESSSTDLAAVGGGGITAPFVVLLDRGQGTGVLASDARLPVMSSDGRHVAHTRSDTVVRTSWISGTPYAVTSVIDVAPVAPSTSPAVSQHGRWLVFGSDDGPGLTDDDRFAAGEHVWITDLRPDGSLPDVTTTSPTTTDATSTTGPTTTDDSAGPVDPTVTPQSTVPIGTLPPDVRFPPRRLSPRTTFPSSSASGTSSSSSGATDTTTSELPPSFDVGELRFADTIAAAGRTVDTVTLRNPGSEPVVVAVLRIEPADATPFAIVSDTCTSVPLPPAGNCSIDVEFRPQASGTATGTLIADTDAAAGAVALVLAGDGVGPPTLDVVPDVAMAGQVVTVFGSGFPVGATVDFTWGLGTSATHAAAQTAPIVVDAAGGFAHVVVVLPNTLPGPVPLRVQGQVDRFADVSADLLVSGSRGGSSPAARAASAVTR